MAGFKRSRPILSSEQNLECGRSFCMYAACGMLAIARASNSSCYVRALKLQSSWASTAFQSLAQTMWRSAFSAASGSRRLRL